MTKSNTLILLSCLIALLGACRPIPEEERFLPVEVETGAGRSVLIEDFSGVGCINCPVAAQLIASAAEPHGDKVIIVALHGDRGRVGTPEEEDPAHLYHPDAATYLSRLQTDGSLPVASFNRTPLASNGNKLFTPRASTWPGIMQELRRLPRLYKINLQASVADRNVSIVCSVDPLSDAAEPHRLSLQLWLIEDGIVAPQHFKDGVNRQFVHNHIFRQALNGIDGTPCTPGETYRTTAAIEQDLVQTANAAVVAFISDETTREVYEVAKVSLVTP